MSLALSFSGLNIGSDSDDSDDSNGYSDGLRGYSDDDEQNTFIKDFETYQQIYIEKFKEIKTFLEDPTILNGKGIIKEMRNVRTISKGSNRSTRSNSKVFIGQTDVFKYTYGNSKSDINDFFESISHHMVARKLLESYSGDCDGWKLNIPKITQWGHFTESNSDYLYLISDKVISDKVNTDFSLFSYYNSKVISGSQNNVDLAEVEKIKNEAEKIKKCVENFNNHLEKKKGIYHGDLAQGQNILLNTTEKTISIIDFGTNKGYGSHIFWDLSARTGGGRRKTRKKYLIRKQNARTVARKKSVKRKMSKIEKTKKRRSKRKRTKLSRKK
jgi:serine/threonine protein kinase